jgi:hypothetical protein
LERQKFCKGPTVSPYFDLSQLAAVAVAAAAAAESGDDVSIDADSEVEMAAEAEATSHAQEVAAARAAVAFKGTASHPLAQVQQAPKQKTRNECPWCG